MTVYCFEISNPGLLQQVQSDSLWCLLSSGWNYHWMYLGDCLCVGDEYASQVSRDEV